MMIRVYGLSDKGLVRERNEDCLMVSGLFDRTMADVKISAAGVHFNDYGLLCAVADGMGGHRGGAYASKYTLELLSAKNIILSRAADAEGASTLLDEAVRDIHKEVMRVGKENRQLAGMGTTLTGVYLRSGIAVYFHVGDSRLYRFRAGYLVQLTSDDSTENRARQFTGQFNDAPKSGAITDSIGGGTVCTPKTDRFSFQDHDQLLLCTDGLTDMIDLEIIEEVLRTSLPVEQKARTLVEKAKAAGGHDNITVILIGMEREPF
ncbi:MAG: protein phosphatase 2C domain-containing protein [Bacillota bacterium]|nr:protein phosphatase 2C domain-containing protein [Bacillota bacterium]MDW7684998.1 protein phosphatase 2C domain-containing protein [Bacillota bacterium]